MATELRKISHWIIVNHKRNCIWQNPFITYDGAAAELRRQEATYPNHDWVIEERSKMVSVDAFDGLPEKKKARDF